MEVLKQVDTALWREYSELPSVSLDDLLDHACGLRHVRRMEGVPLDYNEDSSRLLLRKIDSRIRESMVRHLRRLDGTLAGGHTVQHRRVDVPIEGMVGQTLVSVDVILSSATDPSPRTLRRLAAQGYVSGCKTAQLITIDRNSQDLSAWTVTPKSGDFKEAAQWFLDALSGVEAMLDGSSPREGHVPSRTCDKCVYRVTCKASKGDKPSATHPSEYLNIVRNTQVEVDLHMSLMEMNQEPDGRMTHVLHPSSLSISRCDREQVYDLLGEEQRHNISPKLRRIFSVGHAFHDVIQGLLSDNPAFKSEVLVRDDKLRIAGHCDGVLPSGDGLEIKTISEKGFQSLRKPKGGHVRQGTIYSAILGLKAMRYVYVNKANGMIQEYLVPFDRKLWVSISAQAKGFTQAAEKKELPPRLQSKEYICSECKYSWTCKPTDKMFKMWG